MSANPTTPTADPELAAANEVRALRARYQRLEGTALDLLFRGARTHNAWTNAPVTDEALQELFALFRDGPTSANSNPARFVFVRTRAGRGRLAGCVAEGNVPKVLAAPVVAIVAYDPAFWTLLPRLFPHRDMSAVFRDNPALAEATAFRNASLQGAYLILAARALGLDTGPMSGFDHAKVDAAFLEGTGWKSNFLCAIGHGDERGLFPRLPRPDFQDVCRMA